MSILETVLSNRIILNLIVFILFSLIITYLSNQISERFYDYRNWICRVRNWERKGKFYQDKFKVKLWKDRLPELGDFVGTVFPKKYIKEYSEEYLTSYLVESCKAELTHWAIIFSVLIFNFWNNFCNTTLMLAIAFVLNFPFVIIQRYNRPRIIEIMKKKGLVF